MVNRLILVLGDQLSLDLSALAAGDKARDLVVMAELGEEATYVPHHPKKIAFFLAAMRHHAQALREAGWQVAYGRLEDPQTGPSIGAELRRRARQSGATELLVTEPGEWRLRQALAELPLKVTVLPDTRFIAPPGMFAAWAEGRKQLRMEYFYREMRRRTGLLMDAGTPAGGKWNYDHENRRPAAPDLLRRLPLATAPDGVTAEVLDLVAARFGGNFGALEDFRFATTRAGAEAARADFLAHRLPEFGATQDAMLAQDRTLNHALLGLYLNVGLLDPLETCRLAEAEYHAGRAPLNAVEGFIRQILGWREFVRGIYDLEGPDYVARNGLAHSAALPGFFWDGETDMACLSHVLTQTREEAYAHHIQRLMVTGNFALLAGVDPAHVHEWYLAVYADAVEWVEAPNVIGMSQFADGGLVGSKPYVSSGAYINRMSDYCRGCRYDVRAKSGAGACPFNLLYWHFLTRHRARFERNPRMAQMYRTWDKMDPAHRATVLAEGDGVLARLGAGERL